MMQFKKLRMMFTPSCDVHMSELIVMNKIQDCAAVRGTVHVSDIQKNSHVSKPAISQMLSTLEKKGYIVREIDVEDRRKIAVSLTSKGREEIAGLKADMDSTFEEIVLRFGESNTKQLLALFGKVLGILEEINSEKSGFYKCGKGDDRID